MYFLLFLSLPRGYNPADRWFWMHFLLFCHCPRVTIQLTHTHALLTANSTLENYSFRVIPPLPVDSLLTSSLPALPSSVSPSVSSVPTSSSKNPASVVAEGILSIPTNHWRKLDAGNSLTFAHYLENKFSVAMIRQATIPTIT